MDAETDSVLSTAPGLSTLEVPTQYQRSDDGASTKPTLFQQISKKRKLSLLEEPDWLRLKGFSYPTDDKKTTSFIYKHGWRLWSKANKNYWLCQRCHSLSTKLKGLYNVQGATTSAAEHMQLKHRINEDGVMLEMKQPSNTKTLDTYYDGQALNNEEAIRFEYSVFLALLYAWIIHDNIAFRKLDSHHFRALLTYLQPRCTRFIPSHQTVSRTIDSIHDKSVGEVTEELRQAISKISFSFDMWTSGNKLALLGLVAHFITATGESKAILLGLPRQKGRHTGRNMAETVCDIINGYSLQDKIGFFISDNASNNPAAIDFIATEYGFIRSWYWIRCAGHVFNLVGQAVLLGKDPEVFEAELITAEATSLDEAELILWRKRGPIGKLHNVLTWIDASPQRWELCEALQLELIAPHRPEGKKAVYRLRHDVCTRWHSFDDSSERALYLRPAIDEIVQREIALYNDYCRRRRERGYEIKRPEPSIVRDALSDDDWHVISLYRQILNPLREFTKLLEGKAGGKFGAIWQVLPAYEKALGHFEELRAQYPVEDAVTDDNEPITAQKHFRLCIQLGWKKLNEYYTRLDDTPAYVAAIVLHPRMKWKWLKERNIQQRWAGEEDLDQELWIDKAQQSFNKLWRQYQAKTTPPRSGIPVTAAAAMAREGVNIEPHQRSRAAPANDSLARKWLSDDESSDDDTAGLSELDQYLQERRAHRSEYPIEKSPIPYWISKQDRWPNLSRMALDIYAVPAMSDEPERQFSATGDALSPRRRQLDSDTIGCLMTLKSWIATGLIVLTAAVISNITRILPGIQPEPEPVRETIEVDSD